LSGNRRIYGLMANKLRIKRTSGCVGDLTGSISGVLSVFERMKNDRGLILRSILPAIFSIILFAGTAYLCARFIYPFSAGWLPAGSAMIQKLLRWILSPVAVFVCAMIFCAGYGLLSFVCGPLLSLIAARAELQYEVHSIQPFTAILTLPFRMIRASFIALTGAVFFLPLNFIPIAGNALYSVIFLILLLVFCGIPYYELVFSRHGFSFKQRLLLFWKYKWRIAGTGAGFVILSLIPFAGFFAYTAATYQAADFFCEKVKNEILVLEE